MPRWLVEDKATPTSLHKKDQLICNDVLNSETNASNGFISVEHRRRRHRHRQRHGGIRNNGKILNSGEDGKTGIARSAMVGEMVNTIALSPHFFCKRMSCMRRGVKTEHLTGRSTHVYFLVAPCSTVVSHFTFHPMHLHWLKA